MIKKTRPKILTKRTKRKRIPTTRKKPKKVKKKIALRRVQIQLSLKPKRNLPKRKKILLSRKKRINRLRIRNLRKPLSPQLTQKRRSPKSQAKKHNLRKTLLLHQILIPRIRTTRKWIKKLLQNLKLRIRMWKSPSPRAILISQIRKIAKSNLPY